MTTDESRTSPHKTSLQRLPRRRFVAAAAGVTTATWVAPSVLTIDAAAAQGSTRPRGTLYVIDMVLGLHTVDRSTGAATPVGPHGLSGNAAALAYDSTNDILYATADDLAPPGPPALCTVDRATGTFTIVGSTGVLAPGLAYHPATDTLFATDVDGGNLATVDRATGLLTTVGSTGVVAPVALTYDSTHDVIYGSDNLSSARTLNTVNPATGAFTPIGVTGLDRLNGLAWVPDTGTLYGVDFGTASLHTIDRTTAAPTLVGPLGISNPIGLAYVL